MPAPTHVPPTYRPTPTADLPLFAASARARATDPATSHAAAADVDVDRLEHRVLRALRMARSPKTTHQIASLLNEQLVSVSQRMRPLEKRGLVERAGKDGRRTLWTVSDAA